MGFLDSLMGNASEVDPKTLEAEFQKVLMPKESITRAYQVFRDSFLFTTHRLILIDKQGMSGKKIAYVSIPYGSITHFSVETAGHFDLDAELKIWIRGGDAPIQKKFSKQLSVYDVQKTLALYVLK
ncbi:MAG: PH domain-containing protein [Acidobacteria bacterium]|nr:PH domain-containing protein [Acidobacteriota bacterium]